MFHWPGELGARPFPATTHLLAAWWHGETEPALETQQYTNRLEPKPNTPTDLGGLQMMLGRSAFGPQHQPLVSLDRPVPTQKSMSVLILS